MFQAAVDENEASTVFVGRVPAASQEGWIRLRQIDPAARTPEQLHQILRQSIEQFLLQALGLYMARSAFDEHWSRASLSPSGPMWRSSASSCSTASH